MERGFYQHEMGLEEMEWKNFELYYRRWKTDLSIIETQEVVSQRREMMLKWFQKALSRLSPNLNYHKILLVTSFEHMASDTSHWFDQYKTIRPWRVISNQ